MKSYYSFTLSVLIALVICNQPVSAKAILNNSFQNSRISGFTGVAVSGNFDVKIILGSSEGIKINASEEIVNSIEARVEDNVLIIRYKPRTGWHNQKKVNIVVNAKTIESLIVSGSGSIKVDGTIKCDNLNTNVSGSGSITLNTNVYNYTAIVSGSGKINATGKTKDAQIILSGSGNFSGDGLYADKAEVKVSGSGNASIAADKTLDAMVSGSGNIRYTGNAQVTKSKSGSGSIVRL
jgi:hypothetical protein